MHNVVKITFYSFLYNYLFLQVGGAALDVFEQEPPTDPLTLEIIQHKAVIATPHLGNIFPRFS